MADLRWLKAGNALISENTSVRSGSQVFVQGRHYENVKALPDQFTVHRTYGRLMTRYLRLRNRPVTLKLADLDAIRETDTSVMSQPWIVPTTGRRHEMPVYAFDRFRNESYRITANSVASVRVGPNITIAGNGGSIGDVTTVASVDPVIDFTILLPWATEAGQPIQGIVEEMADVLYQDFALDEATGQAPESLYGYVAWAMPPEPPRGWSIDLAVSRASLDAGESLTFGIRFRTPTPGASAFAIQATADIDGSIETVVSDLMVIEAHDADTVLLTHL
jgi:hypothetical protein